MAIERIDNIGVAVEDVERVGRFFESALGVPVELDPHGDPPSAQVKLGAQYLYVFQVEAAPDRPLRTPDLTHNAPGLDHISFTVDDVDATYNELCERGVHFDGEPVTEDAWGIRMAGFQDPEGNRYYLVQPLS